MRPRRDGGRVEWAPAVTSRDLLLDLAARLEDGGAPMATEDEYGDWVHAQQRARPGAEIPYLTPDVPLAVRRFQARETVLLMTPELMATMMAVAVEAGTPEAEALARHVAALRERKQLIKEYKLESLVRGDGKAVDSTDHPPKG